MLISYVDAFYNKDKDIVQVVERVNGKRVYNDFPAWRTFYIKDPRGEYTSIHGEKVRQIKCKRLKDLHKDDKDLINQIRQIFEDTRLGQFKSSMHIGKNYRDMEEV